MKSEYKAVILGLFAYIFLYIAMARVVGMLAAIATPSGYFDWYRDNDLLFLGLWLWDLCTVIPGMAIISFVISFIFVRYLSNNWRYFCITVAVLYLSVFWLDMIVFLYVNPMAWDLNGYSIIIPRFTPLVFIMLGGWVANKARTKAIK